MRQIDRQPRKSRIPLRAFTLVEIMIVVAIIALLAAIALPSFLRARKRSQATIVKNDLRLIDHAVAQYALETNKTTGDPVGVDDWVDYIKDQTRLGDTGQDVFGNDYSDQVVDSLPYVPGATWDLLSDVADTAFWSPYPREAGTGAPAPPSAKRKRGHRHRGG
jgi:prepilin-type N-terminal cleavage/methylation domain-containing protein